MTPAQTQIFAEWSVERRPPIRPELPTKLKMQKKMSQLFLTGRLPEDIVKMAKISGNLFSFLFSS